MYTNERHVAGRVPKRGVRWCTSVIHQQDDAAYNITGITTKVHVRGFKGLGSKDHTACIIQGPHRKLLISAFIYAESKYSLKKNQITITDLNRFDAKIQ